MTTILLLLLVFFVFVPLVKSILIIHRARRQARDFFNQFKQQPADSQSDNTAEAQGKPKKKIDPSEGEFVNFEELPADRDFVKSTSAEETHVVIEQQIVDAEWEDIKPDKDS